ncbi:MAG: glycosyltransferase family 1 protein [Candidatus Moraniibacteriota bacterium]
MHIGINAKFLAKKSTGIGQVTDGFLRAFAKLPEIQGHEVTLYVAVREKASIHFNLPPGWKLLPVSSPYPREDVIGDYLWEAWALSHRVKRDAPDVFFSLYQAATILPSRIRHVMLVHDLVPLRFPEYLAKWSRKWHYRGVVKGIRGATEIVTPSLATKNDLEGKLGLSGERVHIVPLGIGDAFRAQPTKNTLREVLEKYRLKPGYLYHGGGLEIRKNTRRLLEAYRELLREGRALPPLVISGHIHSKTNPLATPVAEILEELHLQKNVRLIGFVTEEDLPSLYAGASLFLFPSLFEGFGLPVVEAMAMGIPTLTSNTSSLPEVGGDAVLLCDPESVSSLEVGLGRLLDDKVLREKLREAGKIRASNFTWERFTERVSSLLIE